MRGSLERARFRPFLTNTVVLSLVGGMLAFGAVLAGSAPASATPVSTPDVQLSGGPATSVLYGRNIPVALTASLPAGAPKGYNLAYRFVLPAGTTYVGGSAGDVAGEPTVLANKPTGGKTTLIWPNTYDLVANASHTLAFEIAYRDTGDAAPRYDVGDPVAIDMGAYLSTDPRDEADFDSLGKPVGPTAGSYSGWAEKSTTTQLTAIEIAKSEPHPEGEIPRGVHDHQTVYTLTLTNNDVNPTTGVTVDDYLPAGLEFLGCAGTDDHSAGEEYAGSGPIVVTEPTTDCIDPVLVETVDTDPDGSGPLTTGTYTHVRWTHPGAFTPGQVKTIRYAAAIPIRENTMTWPGATPATTGTQTANLDNNSGPETYDEQPLLNGAIAAGSYQSPIAGARAVSDEGTLLRTAEDIAIQKSNDNNGLEQGDLTKWTVDLQVSEYRYVDHVVVRDTVPNGLCPLGATNLTTGNSASDTECAPTAGKLPNHAYTSVDEQSDGTFAVVWDESTWSALAHLAPSETRQLTFWTRTRANYQSGFQDSTPVLSRDAVTNNIATEGVDWVRCAPADPSCTAGGTKIWHTETDGELDFDVSQSGKAATGPAILKQVAATYPADGNCNDLDAAAYGRTVPTYGPGDLVCWKLRLTFPTHLDTFSQDVFDVLPKTLSYVPGSWHETVNNTLDIGAFDDTADNTTGRLSWEIGGGGTDVDAGGEVFEVTLKTTVGSPFGHHSGDVEGNLQKFSYQNTAGKAFTLRDLVDFRLKLPELGVTKTADDDEVEAGQAVHYTVGVKNTGTAPAEDARVWDELPDGTACPDISAISDGGSCADGRITWTGIDVAAAATKNLTYTLTVPADVSPGVTYTNHVGVMEWTYVSNDGTPYQLIPANTTVTDSTLPPANMPAAEATESIHTRNAVVTKSQTTSVNEGGNDSSSQATVGEIVTYTVTTKIPKNTTVYGAKVTDPLGNRQTLVPGSLCVSGCTLDGAPFTPTEAPANTVLATLPATYAAPAGVDGRLVLTFQVKVLDVTDNHRGQPLDNTAALTYTDQDGVTHTRTGSTSTTIVEPKITLGKTHSPSGTVTGGQVLDFTVTAGNGSAGNVSTAHDVVVTDVVPAGTEPVDGSGNPIADGATVWSPDGGTWDAATRTITWTTATTPALSAIAPGANVPLRYRVRLETSPVAGTKYKNVADAEASGMPGAVTGERTSASSTNPGDYQAHADDTLTVALPTISKTVTPDPVTIGTEVTWHLAVTVPANVRVFDGAVVDAVPSGYDVDSYGDATCASGCPGSDPAIVRLPLAGGSSNSTVAAWYLGDLVATGSPRVYDLVLNGHLRDTYRGSATKVKDGDALSNAATVRTNQHDTVTTDPTTVPSGFDDTVTSNTVHNHVNEPKLAIDKSVSVGDGANIKPGQALTYTVKVTNTGTWPAYDVVVTDLPDSELVDVVPVSGAGFVTDGWTAGDPDLRWTVPGPIAPGATVTFTYTADVAPAGIVPPSSTVHNTAAIDTYHAYPAGVRDANQDVIVYRDYHGPSDSVDLNVIPYADLEITKVADQASYQGADVITWTLSVTNHGLSPAADVVVTDSIPAKATFQSATPGSCVFASPTVTCSLGTVPSGATQVITVQGVAKGLPSANQTTDPHSHDLTVSKVEQYVTLQAGEATTTDLSCAGNGYLSDGSAEIMHVDQGTGSPADVLVGRASTLTPNSYRFTLTNTTTGQAQVKLFGTCLPHDTEVTEGHTHGLDVGAATALDTGAMTVGRHSFTIAVGAAATAIAPGIELQSGNARLVGSEPVAGGWRLTVEALTPARATLSLRELGSKTLASAPSSHQHALTVQHVVRTVSVPDGESVQRVTCPDGSKGIVGTYDLPVGVVLLGHEPQPINRDFRLLNTTGHAVDVMLDLECLAIRTGPVLDETFTLTNTATVTSATYDPDLSNNSASATSALTVSAGTTAPGFSPGFAPSSGAASAKLATLSVGAKGKKASVTISCASSVDVCQGTLRLTATVKRPGHHAKRVVIGARSYQVRSGQRVKVAIKVKPRFHQAIRKGRVHGYRFR